MKMRLKKSNLYDNLIINKIFSKKNVYSQSLKLMRFSKLLNLNILPNYIYYNNFFFLFNKFIKNYYNNYFYKFFNLNYIFNLNFLLKKQIFNNFNLFKHFLLKFDLKYIFFKNDFLKQHNLNFYGNNFYLTISNIYDVNKYKLLLSEKHDLTIFNKYDYNNYILKLDFSYFLNFNLFILNILEYYKILIYIHLKIII